MKLRRSRPRIDEVLLQAGMLEQAGLEKALDRQRLHPGRLGTHLLALGLITEDDLAKALSIQHGVPPFLPSLVEVDPGAVARMPSSLARRLKAVPFDWQPEKAALHVAVASPTDLTVADEIRFASGARKIVVHVAPEVVVDRLISRHYEGVEPQGLTPEISLGALVPRAPTAAEPTPSRRGHVLIADPDSRRRRALASLFEASGYRALRAASEQEAASILGGGEWVEAWVQEEWKASLTPLPEKCRTYFDPVLTFAAGAGESERLGAEAVAFAEWVSERLLGDLIRQARNGVNMVRLLASRRSLDGVALDRLLLRAWKAALSGWSDDESEDSSPAGQILAAVKLYQKAILRGLRPTEAADLVRKEASLEPMIVTTLIRMAIGEDLLARFEGAPRLLAMLPGHASAALAHLRAAGWEIDEGEPSGSLPALGRWEVALATMAEGVPFLENLAKARADAKPAVFILSEKQADPDTMYALRLGAEDVLPLDTNLEVLETKLRRVVSRRAPTRASVTGNLGEMSLADTLQVLANGQKTGVVHVNGPEGSGEVAVERGGVVDARTGDLVGEEALYAMIAWEEGSFHINPGERPCTVTVSGSTEGLLMEGFRRLDEARREGTDRAKAGGSES